MKKAGLIHLYTGDGKGKTTAAVGLAVRAAGSGGRVLFVQFLKARPTGELKPLAAVGVEVYRLAKSDKFICDMTEEEKNACREAQAGNLAYARQHAADYDLLILDEVVGAVTSGMLPLEDLLAFLETRPAGLEVVLTGRNAPAPLQEMADYLSEIQARKHPYQNGINARKGIEF